MAAFCPTTSKELTAVLAGHFAAETVLVKTTALGGLESSFHRTLSFVEVAKPAGRFVRERKGNTLSNILQTLRSNIFKARQDLILWIVRMKSIWNETNVHLFGHALRSSVTLFAICAGQQSTEPIVVLP